MIYEPQVYFNVARALTSAFFAAVARLAADYVIGQNRDWSYYVGYGFGGAALATGIPDANAYLYVVGAGTVSLFFESSPGAATARIFLDGVLSADLDLSDEVVDVIEHVLNIPNDALEHSIQVINLGTHPDHPTPTDWLSILGLAATGDTQVYERRSTMPYDIVRFKMRDAEADTRLSSVPIYIPTGESVADIQTWVNAFVPELNALTDSAFAAITLELTLTVPGGARTDPVAGAYNERGGLITFDTSGPRKASFRIPSMNKTIMPGNSFSILDTDVAALITRLTTATTNGNIRPVTEEDYQFTEARKGTKSARKS